MPDIDVVGLGKVTGELLKSRVGGGQPSGDPQRVLVVSCVENRLWQLWSLLQLSGEKYGCPIDHLCGRYLGILLGGGTQA